MLASSVLGNDLEGSGRILYTGTTSVFALRQPKKSQSSSAKISGDWLRIKPTFLEYKSTTLPLQEVGHLV
jgi:hypothetical protein